MGTQVILKNVRVAFVDSLIGAAKDYKGDGKFRHSATFIIEPDSEPHKQLLAAVDKEAQQAYGKNWSKILEALKPQKQKYCLEKDKSNSSGDIYDGFEGKIALSAHRKAVDGRPLLLDIVKDPSTGKAKHLTGEEGRIYGGCYVNAKVEIWAQSGTNQGIRAGLLGVQFVKDGDSFGGATRPSDDGFESIEAEEDLA